MKHLSADQIEKLRNKDLTASEFLTIDDHLAECDQCRKQLFTGDEIQKLRNELTVNSLEEPEHLKFEKMAAWVDGLMNDSERTAVDEHLQDCSICSREVNDLRAFRKSMADSTQKQTVPFQKKHVLQFWPTASLVAAMVAIVAMIAVFVSQNRIAVLQTKLKELETKNEKLQSGNQGEQLKQREQPSAIFQDGNAQIRIEKDGSVTASVLIPKNEQERIRRVLENQKLDVPQGIQELIGRKEILMGDSDKLPFELLSPIGTAVASERPTFHWKHFAGAQSYQVRIYDSDFRSVMESPWISQTEWTPSRSLPLGKSLIWQVAARKQNEEIISPYAPHPDAKFLILMPSEIKQINAIEDQYVGFHLILGVQYAQFGLLDDAEKEFVALKQTNPNSKEAAKLLSSLRTIRYSYSKDTESK